MWPIDVGVRDKEGATANLAGVCVRRQWAAKPWKGSVRCRSVLTTDEQAMAWPLWLFTTREQIQMRQYALSSRLSRYSHPIHRCMAHGAAMYWSEVRAWILAEANLLLPVSVFETPHKSLTNERWIADKIEQFKSDGYIVRGKPLPRTKKGLTEELYKLHVREHGPLDLPAMTARYIEKNMLADVPWPPKAAPTKARK